MKVLMKFFTIFCVGIISSYAQTKLTVNVASPGDLVAPICRGQQIEDFNQQLQGGLYAQLINNPSFEQAHSMGDVSNLLEFWSIVKPGTSNGSISSSTSNLLNSAQKHCLQLTISSVTSGGVGAANSGHWGIKLVNNTTYKVSFWAKAGSNYSGSLIAKLESNSGTVYASDTLPPLTTSWAHDTCTLTTSGISGNPVGTNRFVIYGTSTGTVYIDVVTVMPPTYKNRPNGMRPDLGAALDSLKFKFIEVPGGCTAESKSMDVCWGWKNSIGPIEQRPGSSRIIWGYRNMLYFGVDDFFNMCEDIGGAQVVFCVSSGVSSDEVDNWGSCPLDSMKPIIDDITDLIEYCNGSTSTKWGATRAANGHAAPYNLKYIEIGNEGQATGDNANYRNHYTLVRNAIKAKDPNIQIMYNGIIESESPTSAYGLPMDFADEHFYMDNLSSLYDKYSSIDPNCKKICVAEYANSNQGNGGNVIGNHWDALQDASFMLGCEKNSKNMWWTGYGNYGGFIGHTTFAPCIVWNDAVSCFCTPSYYGQKILFSDNLGTRVLPFTENSSRCYFSTSIDTGAGKNDVLVKVVNPSGTSEAVTITLSGASNVNSTGHYTRLTGASTDENSLANPTKVYPTQGTFTPGTSFSYTFGANSINVLRISLGAPTSTAPIQDFLHNARAPEKTVTRIFSLDGKLVSQSIKYYHMKNGIYFVKSSDNTRIKKILIEH